MRTPLICCMILLAICLHGRASTFINARAARATSMYLLAQYFIQLNGGEADLKLQGLKAIYENIRLVNRSMAGRLRAASREDSSINALIILDLFAKALPYVIQESLEELRYLFSSYLGDK